MLNAPTESPKDKIIKILKVQSFDLLFQKNPLPATAHETKEMQLVKKMLDCGLSIDSTDVNGATLLMWASADGNLPIAQWLLANGANPEIVDFTNETALIKAAQNPKLAMVELLLRAKVDLEKMDMRGNTALAIAVGKYSFPGKCSFYFLYSRFNSIIKALLRQGANPQTILTLLSGEQLSLLKVTITTNNPDLASILINNLKNRKDQPNLFEDEFALALGTNSDKILKKLLTVKPSLLENHENAISNAVIRGQSRMVEMLLKFATPLMRQKLLNYPDAQGALPLSNAFELGYLACAKHLLSYGADINKLNATAEGKKHYQHRLGSKAWVPMLRTYMAGTQQYDAHNPIRLVTIVADSIHRYKPTDVSFEGLGLPPELVTLCEQAPVRASEKGRYMLSTQTRAFLMTQPYALATDRTEEVLQEQSGAKRRCL